MTAASWLETLAARGVSVTLRSNRLWLHPAHAHKELSDGELLFLRHNRAEIKALVKTGIPPEVQPTATTPEPCQWCNRAPCIGREHPVFAVLHALDEPEQRRRHAEQFEKDLRGLELRRRYGLPVPTWDL